MQYKRKEFRQMAAGALLILSVTGCSDVDTVSSHDDRVALSARLDAQMPQWLQDTGVPGAAIAVMEDGKLTLVAGYGYANTDRNELMTEDHVFNAASLSKPVSAWGVLRLVDEGRIDLDAPINDYLERWTLDDGAGRAEDVTIRRLLSHTAGISMPSTPGFRWPMETPSLVQVLDGDYTDSTYADPGTAAEIVYSPGEAFRYSGGGYLLLQLLIEEVTNLPFEDYMQALVFGPLGMDDSQFGWTESISVAMATPYTASGNTEDTFRLPGHAASSLHTSASDLGAWLLASTRGSRTTRSRVISEDSFELMHTPVADVEPGRGDLGQMGLGYFVHPSDDILVVGHRGGNAGWRARFRLAPDAANGFVLLTNSDSGNELIGLVSCAWAAMQPNLTDIDGCH